MINFWRFSAVKILELQTNGLFFSRFNPFPSLQSGVAEILAKLAIFIFCHSWKVKKLTLRILLTSQRPLPDAEEEAERDAIPKEGEKKALHGKPYGILQQ